MCNTEVNPFLYINFAVQGFYNYFIQGTKCRSLNKLFLTFLDMTISFFIYLASYSLIL